jgi:hypothetical protein
MIYFSREQEDTNVLQLEGLECGTEGEKHMHIHARER